MNSSAGITGRPCPHLRLALLSQVKYCFEGQYYHFLTLQAKKFLEIFHENKKEKLR